MAMYKIKKMNETQIAEMQQLLNSEHRDTIIAYANEHTTAVLEGFCDGIAEGCIKNFFKGTIAGACMVGLVYVAIDQGIIVYRKLKEKKEPKPWDKPGRDWEV